MAKIIASMVRNPESSVKPETETGELVLINIELLDKKKRKYLIMKRVQDIVFSALGIIILLPVFLVISAAILLDDPQAGPIFVQRRVGKDGKEFRFYKFRTMIAHAESYLDSLLEQNEKDGPVFKIKNDPRITRVGKFLRTTSLDELPQLLNVFNGTMSLVGPRPPLPREVNLYTAYQKQRLYVTPGITCFWQIHPNRDEVKFDDWLDMDLSYIRERSMAVDWKILFGTVGAVFRGNGE